MPFFSISAWCVPSSGCGPFSMTQNARGVADGGEPVGDDQRGAALGQRVEGRLNLGLGDGVQGGGGLVRMRIGGFFRKIRAMAMRCFCPPDSSVPRSPT